MLVEWIYQLRAELVFPKSNAGMARVHAGYLRLAEGNMTLSYSRARLIAMMLVAQERPCLWTWAALMSHTKEYRPLYFAPGRN